MNDLTSVNSIQDMIGKDEQALIQIAPNNCHVTLITNKGKRFNEVKANTFYNVLQKLTKLLMERRKSDEKKNDDLDSLDSVELLR